MEVKEYHENTTVPQYHLPELQGRRGGRRYESTKETREDFQ